MDNFPKNCLERKEEFKVDVLVFFIISWAYATVKVTTSGQICEMSVYIEYCNTNCNIDQPYLNILQFVFYHIVSPLCTNIILLALSQTTIFWTVPN